MHGRFDNLYGRKIGDGATHEEYWIFAEDLEEFNRNIVGKIEVVAEFKERGENFVLFHGRI